MDHPPLGRSYLLVVPSYDISCALILLTRLYGLDFMTDIDINSSWIGPIFGVWIGPTLGVPKWTSRYWAAAIWYSTVVWYIMCLDSLNWALWVRFQWPILISFFIEGSNIWGVDRTDSWGPEMDHPSLSRSYLVVVSSYDMSCALILLTGLYGWASMADMISILHRWVQYLGYE